MTKINRMSETEKTTQKTAGCLIKVESTELDSKTALELSIERFGNFSKHEIKKPKRTKQTVRLVWTGKWKLFEFVYILKKKKYIKSKSEFFALFDDDAHEVKVRWNPDKKYHLAYLLYRLYQEKYIILVGGKGYFKYVEEHFVDYNETSFKRNALKNIKLKILNNIKDYAFICKEVETIIAKYLT
jgi:hypothetical protein